MTYRIKFKRSWRWRCFEVCGHHYESSVDKMTLYFPGGSLREIPCWSKCEVVLDVDWMLAVKKKLEADSGQSVPLNVGGA
jgi:hypothetical protein